MISNGHQHFIFDPRGEFQGQNVITSKFTQITK